MEKMMGVMLDCSRNAVMKSDVVKEYANIIRKMGYNTLMLYTEDTYEVDNQPYFGHLRGRYTKDEIKEMDTYCREIGIELIPCIQTLAHLPSIFKWSEVYTDINDCDDILLAGDERTYELIEDMISTVAECFSSRKIHIGMDEAYHVGTGKYRDINGSEDRFDIVNNHLHRVCKILGKYNFEPMVWSDMFCKLALNVSEYYAEADTSKILEKAKLPENISLVYWDYNTLDYDKCTARIETNKTFGRKVFFAGGAHTWGGFAPNNTHSIKTMEVAMKACEDKDIDGIFFTVWGDDGAECSKFAILPSLMYAAEVLKGNTDLESIKEKFKEITGSDFDDFLLFDQLNSPGGRHSEVASKNPFYADASKYLFYNDIFLGVRDCLCDSSDCEYYKNLTQKLHNANGKGEFEYLFNSYEKFANVLALKSDFGLRIKEAYKKNDIHTLKLIIDECDELKSRIKEFHSAHQERWFFENKPHGFEIQDVRFGGLLQRITSCQNRLKDYVEGKLSEIPELNEPVLEKTIRLGHWSRSVSPNIVTHGL
ncbi:MAG: beta-N-acetylhexosaminidase [Clostridia bacterium]|nr:beta-N-acetylhexosaminidase [Clostridia bacterium]